MSQLKIIICSIFLTNYNSVVPYKQHEQGHQDPYPVCILEGTIAFAQFQILLVKLRAPGTVQQ